jgi:nucleotide-binding universal stress UspA family protein
MTPSLLVGFDGSEASRVAVRLAARLAAGSALSLVHATAPAPLSALTALDNLGTLISGSPGVLGEEWARHEEARALVLLAEGRAEALSAGASAVHTRHLLGRPADVLSNLAASPGCELVVVGPHGHGAWARTLVGSVTDELLRHAHVPVLVARGGRLGHVVVGIDGSPGSLRAAALAGRLARRTGAAVELVAAVEFPIETFVEARTAVRELLEGEARKWFAKARATMNGTPTSEVVVFHEPVHALLTHAERTQADLVVVGRRGPGEGVRHLLGSVSRRIALTAPMSVLVVPAAVPE